MGSNYEAIIRDNLLRFYENASGSAVNRLPATIDGDRFVFDAFGDTCIISPEGISLGNVQVTDPRGIIISLYALHTTAAPCRKEPYRAYKEFPDTMPYAGAFHTHTEQILVPHADKIMESADLVREHFNGGSAPDGIGGDLAFTVNPLPKICLCYIFYAADEDFPASVTCLYSSNAADFLPIDALADVGEYASKKMIELITP